MPLRRKEKGSQGESRASEYLIRRKQEILKKNFRSPYGEVDIISRTKKNLIFTEVKTWDSYREDSLEYAIDHKKQEKLMATARFFLWKNPKYSELEMRFDVIFLSRMMKKLKHIPHAFTLQEQNHG